MKTTADFLDELRVKLNLSSDGKLADYLGMHRQHISRYRTLEGTFDDAKSMQIAKILEIDPALVVACMHHQRAKQADEKALWADMAFRLGGIAAALLLAVALPYHFGGNSFDHSILAMSVADAGTVYYVKP